MTTDKIRSAVEVLEGDLAERRENNLKKEKLLIIFQKITMPASIPPATNVSW
jgi:hypothetical protein